MKTMILSALFLTLAAHSALANDCVKEVKEYAVDALKPKQVMSVKKTTIRLAPGEDAPLLQGNVWNSSDSHYVDVYLVKSSYMAAYWYGFMVDPDNCSVDGYTEVYFE